MAPPKDEKMSIDIKNFLEDYRSRGLTKQTTATYKSNITTYLNFVGNPLNVDISIISPHSHIIVSAYQNTARKAMTIMVNPSCISVARSIICIPNLGEKIPV